MTLPWMAAKILLRPVAELRAHPGNARVHGTAQIEQIKVSMLTFGFTNPLLVDEAGVLIAGHGRLEAAVALGIEKVPTIVLRHLSVAQKEALRLADNRIAEKATWDQALLRDALSAVQASPDLDLAALGFSAAELDDILAAAGDAVSDGDAPGALSAPAVQGSGDGAAGTEAAPAEDDPADAEPVPPRQAVARIGDIWRMGDHRLACGDSTNPSVIARVMGPERAALLFTSPPYGNQRDYTTGGVSDWDALMQGVFQHLDVAMRPDGQALVNLGLIHRDNEWQPYWSGWLDWMRAQGWRRFGLYAWDQGPGLHVAQRALTAPATVDRAARTVEVVWSTGARARNFVPGLGLITEELEMAPSAVRMDALRSGQAPVLNTHRRGDARDVLGRVVAARLERGRGYATLLFSGAADVEHVWQRIADGTLRAVSVGYRVHRYEPRPDAATGGTVHRAVDWEPFEISVVPVPVDRDAAVRAEGDQGALTPAVEPPLPNEDPPMPETTPAEPVAPPAAPPSAAPSTTADPETTVTDTPTNPPPTSAAPEPARAAPDLDAIRAEASRAERERISGIDSAVEAARALVPVDRANTIRAEAVERGWSVDQVRRALFDAMVAAAPKPSIPARPETGPGHDDPAAIRDAMAEALAVRSMPGYQPPAGGSGRHAEFLGWRPSDMIGELLRLKGERQVPRNPTLLAERAFHTTSDFPALLSAAANKMLLAAYAPAQPTYRQIFLRRDFRDFKPHRHLRVGDFPTLLPLMENGEIQAGTMSESQEIVLLQTFARRIRVTHPMLVNDDLGAFTDFAAAIGRRVADFENATAYGLLNSANGDGPTLTTGNAAVFGTAAARANKPSAGSALDLGSLAQGRAAVMRQRTLDGLPIAVGAQMRLLVGPSLELPARQLTVPVAANQVSQENMFASFVQPVVEPLVQANRWYLFTEPSAAPVYVYGYLNGAEGPQVTTGPVQGVDGIEVSVIFDFGVGAIDWRGGYFNPGT